MLQQAKDIIHRWSTAVWPVTIIGLLLGAVAGGLATQGLMKSSPTATTLIRIDQPIDPDQIVTDNYPAPETQPTFLAGEIVYLSSSGFAKSVGSELNLPSPPTLTAEQQGESTLVTLKAAASTPEEAAAALDVGLKVYADRVQQLSGERTQAAIDANTAVIARVRADTALDATRRRVQLDQQALDNNLRTLEQQRLSLQSQLLRAPGIQVVEPIAADTATRQPLLPTVGGSLLGGLLALAAALAWRSRSGVIVSAQHLERLVSPVLLPVVPLGTRAGARGRSDLDRARTLYGQLPAPRSGEIVVVGASRHSGTDVVARLLYDGAAERVSVTAVDLVGDCAGLSSDDVSAKLAALPEQGAQTVIIDGGSVASAPQVLDVAERARQIVMVVQTGRDVAADVETLLRAVKDSGVPVTAICTKGRLVAWDGPFAARRRSSERDADREQHARADA